MKLLTLTTCLVIILPARTDVKFRLINGDGPNSGRLEVLYSGTWGTICDDSFSDLDAKVACRYFGYGTGIARGRAYYGKGSGQIWMDDLNCNGRETSLDDCNFSGWGQENCAHSEDVGVHCSLVQFRLANSLCGNSGRIEVLYNNTWGTLCDDDFGQAEADVVCRYFGFSAGAPQTHAFYGQGSGSIWMDNLGCSGSETSVEYCTFNGWGNHNCKHIKDAGVDCFDHDINCPGLRAPYHGSVSSGLVLNGTYGRYVSVSCETNYTLVGKSFLQCVSGSWSGTFGTCEADCRELKVRNGSLSTSLKVHGTNVNVSCDTNYTLVGDSILRCVSGSWSKTVGMCEADCPVLKVPNGSLSTSSNVHGTNVNVSCDANYTLVGESILRCVSGSWSKTVGMCEADCPELRAPTHGSLSSGFQVHDTYVTVLCETNYTLVGRSILQCISGSWSESVGTCKADCPELEAPTHGSLSPSSVVHGTYLTVTCNTSYTLTGHNILQCESGLWSETVGTCEADCLGLRAPIHGSLSSRAVSHGTYVTVSCDTNYTLDGTRNLRCVSGSWSGTVGTCEEDCHELRAPIHGSLSSSLNGHGTYIAILCDTSYTLVGESILQCVSGTWSQTIGTCEADPFNEKLTTVIVGATSGGIVLALVGVIIAQRLCSKRKTKADRRTVFASLDAMQMTPADTGNTYSDLSTTVKEQREDNERPEFSGGLTSVSNAVYMHEQDTQDKYDDYWNPNMSDKKPRTAKLTADCPGDAKAEANEMDAQATYENFGFQTRGQEEYEAMDNLGNDENHVYTLDMDQEEGYTNLPFQ